MPPHSFLQSEEWEKFQRSLGRKTWRILGKLVIQYTLPLGLNYLYCPRPDIGQETRNTFFEEAKKIAVKEKSVFLKIDPGIPGDRSSENCHSQLDWESSILKRWIMYWIPAGVYPRLRSGARMTQKSNFFVFGRSVPAKSLQPRKTIMLDLSKPEEELLSAMREKTRYNIRLAERKSVGVYQSDNFEIFLRLLQETAKRDEFHTHERQYYEKLLAIQSENFSNKLFFADYRGKTLAAALVVSYETRSHKIMTYLYGASSREHKEVMAPHLLHWRIIQEAKKRGFQWYDFWGIDESRWPGLTRFKKGFMGEIIEYPHSIDMVYKKCIYKIYTMVKVLNWRI